MTWLPIGDMARTYGLSLRALRFYENRGLIRPRRQGVVRLYGPEERRKVQLILKGKALGFTLSEIQDLFLRECSDAASSLPLSPEQIMRQIAYLKQQRSGLDAAIRDLQRAQRDLDPRG